MANCYLPRTLDEVLDEARHVYSYVRPTSFKKAADIETADKESVTKLLVSHSFDGEIPELSLFPNIYWFHCSRPVSSAYLNRQDLSKVTSLYLTLPKNAGKISINAEQLEDLDVYIVNNEDDQLNFFEMGEPTTLDISRLPRLKRFMLRHGTGCRIVAKDTMPSVEQISIVDMRDSDFQFLHSFPNIKRLTVIDSQCADVSFSDGLGGLEYLNVSRNKISDVAPLLNLHNLKSISLYRNPIQNIHLLDDFEGQIIFTPLDEALSSFDSSLRTAIYTAYRMMEKGSSDNPYRTPIARYRHAIQTDKERFLHFLRFHIEDEIRANSEKKAHQIGRPLSKEEMQNYVAGSYPFLCAELGETEQCEEFVCRGDFVFVGKKAKESSIYYDAVLSYGYNDDLTKLAWDAAHKFGCKYISKTSASFRSGIITGELAIEAAVELDKLWELHFNAAPVEGRRQHLRECMTEEYRKIEQNFCVDLSFM